MNFVRGTLAASVAACALLTAAPSQALDIVLNDVGGVTGTQAETGFKIAADYWGKVLTNNSTVKLDVGFSSLGSGILGSTGSSRADISLTSVLGALNASGNSALDAIALATLNTKVAGGSINAITSGPRLANGNGVDTTKLEWDADGSENNSWIYGNTSLFKALGLTENEYYGGDFSNDTDGGVTFSTNFTWDFDPTDGITAGSYDFIGVAIHEIGHALGFVSGVDLYDYYGFGSGPGRNSGNTFSFDNPGGGLMSVLDLFRYSNDVMNVAPGAGPVLDWSVTKAATIAAGGNPFFSIDGTNQLFGDSRYATGQYNGDGRQASHFKDSPSCTDQLGIMDPTYCSGTMGIVHGLDIAAFDAMGWSVNMNALAAGDYEISTAEIYRAYFTPGAVPEPASWAMMIGGFALVGGTLRARKRTVSFA